MRRMRREGEERRGEKDVLERVLQLKNVRRCPNLEGAMVNSASAKFMAGKHSAKPRIQSNL
jgi:hypothetical protein